MVNPTYWSNKNVLVTGHTGFKGSWLCHWLIDMGASVTGYALPPEDSESLFNVLGLKSRLNSIVGDLKDTDTLKHTIESFAPDVIFHLAAQSLVLTSYTDPIETFNTNVMGTANLLEALRGYVKPCDVIVVTSDKCYLNLGDGKPFTEADSLGGLDPYSASKAAAEIVTTSYRHSFFNDSDSKVRIASARAGNVIGGGDNAPNRLVPDIVRAWINDEPIEVRNPNAIRPWQHVLEPLSGYLLLAEKLRGDHDLAKAWNFGPTAQTTLSVGDILDSIQTLWPDLKLRCR